MIKYVMLLIFLGISARYAYLLYRGRIDFSKFTKKNQNDPIYTLDLKGRVLKQINSQFYAQFIVLLVCWPLFLIKNPYHFILQMISTLDHERHIDTTTLESNTDESDSTEKKE